MIRISDKRKCMASLATFRNMCGKADIYDIVAELARQTIVEKGVSVMRQDEFYKLFKSETGIDVPHSILEASLKRLPFITPDRKEVIVNEKLTKTECESVKDAIALQETKNNQLLDALKAYVEQKEGRRLSTDEERELVNTLCSHIIDDASHGHFIEHVCSFILENEATPEFMEYLNLLREGTLIFVGYTYTSQDGYFDNIDSTINIYLETEILFHMAGYHGNLHKTLFDEFYTQLSEINKKARKPLIKLYYFEETEIEIRNYFDTACRIVERDEVPDPSKQAMLTIIEGCSEAYQVRKRQDAFVQLLKEHQITLDKQSSYNDTGNFALTIEHAKFLETEDASEEKILEKLKFLNNINVKRVGRPQKVFRNVGHLLLSGNSLTFRIAYDDEIRQEGCLPLVFNLSNLTNRFWLSLNRGLIPDMRLNNFSMIAKSRVALANKLKLTISRLYDEIEEELASGEMTLEQAKDSLASLRRDSIMPDQINTNDIDRCIAIIKNGELELYVSMQENKKRREEERMAEGERKVKEAEGKAAAAEKRSSQLQSLNDAVIKAMVAERNKSLRASYDDEVAIYESNKAESVEWDYKEYRNRQWRIVGAYASVYALLFVGFTLATKSVKAGVIAPIIGIVAEFVWNAVPFLRAIVSHEAVQKAFLFIWNDEERDRVRDEFAQEYETNHNRPVLKVATEEDIRTEIEKGNK